MKFVSLLLSFITFNLYAVTPNEIYKEALLNELILAPTIKLAHEILNTCILIPPVTPIQEEKCAVQYVVYLAFLKKLHFDLTGVNNEMRLGNPDPYYLNPYDICKFNIANLILPDLCRV